MTPIFNGPQKTLSLHEFSVFTLRLNELRVTAEKYFEIRCGGLEKRLFAAKRIIDGGVETVHPGVNLETSLC